MLIKSEDVHRTICGLVLLEMQQILMSVSAVDDRHNPERCKHLGASRGRARIME